MVTHDQDDVVAAPVDRQLDRRSGRCVDHRVARQVGQQLAQLIGVAEHRRMVRALQTRPRSGRGHPQVVDRVLGQLRQIDRHAPRLGHLVELGQQQQILDQHAHPHGLGLDPAHRSRQRLGIVGRADPEQLGIAPDRRQRRAQLVRGVGQEPPQPVLGVLARGERGLDLPQHLVQRAAEPADLGARVRRLDPPRQVAGGDLGGGLPDSAQRSQADPDHDRAERDQRQDHTGTDEQLDHDQPVQRLLHLAQRDRDQHRPAVEGPDRGGPVALTRGAARVDRERVQRARGADREMRRQDGASCERSP